MVKFGKTVSISILLLTGIIFSAVAQEPDIILIRKYAENSFRDGDYGFALENYLELYKLDEKDIDINYRIGICYTETNIDKEKAIPYLEFVVGHNNFPVRSYYYLGKAYMYTYRFTEAVEAFYEFKMMGINEDLLRESDRLISMCYYALEKINFPENVTFEHLDSTVNSPYDDYYPMISSDNNVLVFSSNRTYVKEYEDYIANVFSSENKKGTWSKAEPLPTNTYDNEEIVGSTPLMDKILIHADGDYASNDIKMILKKGNKFTKAPDSDLPPDVNTSGVEYGATMSADGNTLIFSSDRRGGRGMLDLYISHKGADGKWTEAENMGSVINTEYDDNFPNLRPDGKTLYFASKGHEGIGEYDLFMSFYSDDTKSWSSPRNLGFPINTPLDNTTISYSADGKEAYVSANRKEGFGKLDIYKIIFGTSDAEANFMQVSVFVQTKQGPVPYSEDFLKAYATIYDVYGNIYFQKEVSGDEGNFFASLYAGKYTLEVGFSGSHDKYTEPITISSDEPFIAKEVTLKSIE